MSWVLLLFGVNGASIVLAVSFVIHFLVLHYQHAQCLSTGRIGISLFCAVYFAMVALALVPLSLLIGNIFTLMQRTINADLIDFTNILLSLISLCIYLIAKNGVHIVLILQSYYRVSNTLHQWSNKFTCCVLSMFVTNFAFTLFATVTQIVLFYLQTKNNRQDDVDYDFVFTKIRDDTLYTYMYIFDMVTTVCDLFICLFLNVHIYVELCQIAMVYYRTRRRRRMYMREKSLVEYLRGMNTIQTFVLCTALAICDIGELLTTIVCIYNFSKNEFEAMAFFVCISICSVINCITVGLYFRMTYQTYIWLCKWCDSRWTRILTQFASARIAKMARRRQKARMAEMTRRRETEFKKIGSATRHEYTLSSWGTNSKQGSSCNPRITSKISATSDILASSNATIVIRKEEYETYVRQHHNNTNNDNKSSQLMQYRSTQKDIRDMDIDNINSPSRHMIGPWCIEDEKKNLIGKGAFSQVYKAIDYTFRDKKKENSLFVAIKIIDNCDTTRDRSLWMAKNEIDCLNKISHPNVIKMISYDLKATFNDKSVIAFVLEYAVNGDLRNLVRMLGGLPEVIANTYLHQIISGLNACHVAGVVHRDLKLDNVVLDSRYIAKICDFGLAKVKTVHSRFTLCMFSNIAYRHSCVF